MIIHWLDHVEKTASQRNYLRSGVTYGSVLGLFLNPSNAAPEWPARSFGRRSQELLGACPLEGLVRHSLEALSGGFVHHADETCIEDLIRHGVGV